MAEWTSLGKTPSILTEETSFEDVLDATCERLWEKQVQYSVRRIGEMEEELIKLEEELTEFISKRIT